MCLKVVSIMPAFLSFVLGVDMRLRTHLPVLLIVVILIAGSAAAQTPQPAPQEELKLETGKQIFEAACIGCHGPNGKGQPLSTLGFEPPSTFPDFTDCNGSTRERTFDWKATIHEGGRGRGFSDIMPSFAEALTSHQIDKVVQYLRSLCDEPEWPLGELNLPRAFATEKAFPEDEWVLTSSVNTRSPGAVESELIYEKRFGVKNQLEFAAPFSFLQRENGGWVGGIGDLVMGYKRVMFASHKSILSLQGEVGLPTGNRSKDLGSGGTRFETFAAFGQRISRSSFVQSQFGAELPVHTDIAPQAVFWRTAIGKTFAQNHGYGRTWTPMTEFILDHDLVTLAPTNWDIIPQVQFSLNKRQHILANVGVQTALNHTADRSTKMVFYVLWDFFDGGLREGW
jgi:mono/diheme cytochrome c family protein